MSGVEGVHPSRQSFIIPPGNGISKPTAKEKGKKKKKKPNKSKYKKGQAADPSAPDRDTQRYGTSILAPPSALPPPPPPAVAAQPSPIKGQQPGPEPLPSHRLRLAFKTGFTYISTHGKTSHIADRDYTSLSSLLNAKYEPTLKSVATLELLLSNPRILHFLKYHPQIDGDMYRCQDLLKMIVCAVMGEGLTAASMAQSETVLGRWEGLIARMLEKTGARTGVYRSTDSFTQALEEAVTVAKEARAMMAGSAFSGRHIGMASIA